MNFISQLPTYNVYGPVVAADALRCHIRFCSPAPQVKLLIFSKIGDITVPFTIDEVKHLVNLLVNEFDLDPHCVTWVEYYLPEKKKLPNATFRLYTFDWYHGRANNPKYRNIFEEWYLSWLQDAGIEYFLTLTNINNFR